MMNPLIIENRQLNTGYNLLEEMYQARFEGRLVPVMQEIGLPSSSHTTTSRTWVRCSTGSRSMSLGFLRTI